MKRKQEIYAERKRLMIVLVILSLGFSVMLARALDLQVLRKDFLQDQGNARYLRNVVIPASRGVITDRNGEPLAISTPVSSIWVNVGEVLSAKQRLPELAGVLGLKASALERRLVKHVDTEFYFIKRHVSPELAGAIRDLSFPGVHAMTEYRRYYPAAEVTSHLVGFTNIDHNGQEGLELAFDDWLQGSDGEKRVIKDRKGRVVENVELVKDARPGRDLRLSIDLRVQYLASRELAVAISDHGARSGSIVILETDTGEVLAMVNQPTYNPNRRQKESDGRMRNRAVTDFFEPGSVIKPFTVVAGLESGNYSPATLIDTSPGTLKIGAHTIRDFRDYGVIDVEHVLIKSSNVGASKMALSLESDHLWDVFGRFGFGTVTGSGFPGESPGILPHWERWRTVEKATLAYGYRLSVTPLQLARAYVVLANEGRIIAPSFVHRARNPSQAVFDPALARQTVKMLEAVVSPAGTGNAAILNGYRVGGKTGTSRKAGVDGYNDRYVASFAGMAPISDPALAVVVVINDPAGDRYYGGQVAAPVFKRVMNRALRLMNLAPDDLASSQRVAAQ